jgi:hypothetical protein
MERQARVSWTHLVSLKKYMRKAGDDVLEVARVCDEQRAMAREDRASAVARIFTAAAAAAALMPVAKPQYS